MVSLGQELVELVEINLLELSHSFATNHSVRDALLFRPC